MDFKELKKLADACRKAGIKHFKNADVEFTLSDEGPVSSYKKRKATKNVTQEESNSVNDIQSDALTQEQLLFWSLPNAEEESEESTQ